MPRYRVTLTRTAIEIVEAPNPYQAAIVASGRNGGDVEIADVRPAVGRPSVAKAVKKTPPKKVTKKRRPMSAATRAKLAQNLVKARAARARKQKASRAKKTKRVAQKK